MRRLDGLQLDEADCARLAPALVAADRALTDLGQHVAAADVRSLAIAAASVAVPYRITPEVVTLSAWARKHGVAATTARRRARTGKLDGARKTPTGWVLNDTPPPR